MIISSTYKRGTSTESLWIRVCVSTQSLDLLQGGEILRCYSISTALRGVGCEYGSHCTPLGTHRVKVKIGTGCPSGAVFERRRYTGQIYSPEGALDAQSRDLILSRILWLEGVEKGVNKNGHVDTLRRYIYIHGTSEENLIGKPTSHGCIRMKNSEIIELFEIAPVGIMVLIVR